MSVFAAFIGDSDQRTPAPGPFFFRAAMPRLHSCKENLPVIALKESSTTAALLVEAAERNEAIVAVTELDAFAWAIEFESGSECLAELNQGPQRLVLTCAIGQPEQERLLEVQEAALSYNTLWETTGGCRIARDAEGSRLLLIQELSPDALQDTHLADWLMRFEAFRAWWAFFISGARDTPQRDGLRTEMIGLLA